MAKNLTIVVTPETARWLRIEAAKHEKSVSRYVGEVLEREREREEHYGAAMERFLCRAPRPLGAPGEPLPSREELHRR